MKKRLAALLAVATLFLFAGCSFSFYQRQAESKDIYKDYLAMETDTSDSYTERVAERGGAAARIFIKIISRWRRMPPTPIPSA